MTAIPSAVEKARYLIAGHAPMAAGLVVVMLLAAISESFGLSMVLPLISGLIGLGPGAGPIAEITARILDHLPGGTNIETVLLVLALAFLAKGIFLVAARGLIALFALRLREDWAARLFDHYLRARAAYLIGSKQGAMIQNTANETYHAARGVIKTLNFINKFILAAVLFGVMLLAHWQATVTIAAVGFAAIFLLRRIVVRHATNFGRRRLLANQEISSVVTESIATARQIKLFGAYQPFQRRLNEKLRTYTRADATFQVVSELPMQMTELSVIVLVSAALLVLKHIFAVELNEAVALLGFFIVLAQRLMTYVSFLVSQRMKIAWDLPALTMIYDLLKDAPAREDINAGATLAAVDSDIAFRGVHFAYDQGKPVLSGLDLTIAKGKTTAIVGPSGIGKSTIADLLLGLFTPQAGTILVNGQDLGRYSLASLRRRIAYVTQEPEIFNGSVRENILLGRPDASDEEVVAAARLARADEFIRDLAERYDTVVGERGAKLSGGQRQRLAIARVILRQPDIYIFDEATSSLDRESERLIQESIDSLAGEATVVIIAHRPSTIEHADAIYQLTADGRARSMGLAKAASGSVTEAAGS